MKRYLLGATLLSLSLLYGPTLVSYHEIWTADVYSHGYPIAALVGWLTWRTRYRRTVRDGGSPTAGVLMIGLSLVWLVGTVANLRAVHQAALPILLACWAVAVWGRSVLSVVVPVTATFLLAVPVWGVLIPPLRSLTVLMSGLLLSLLRVPARIQGDYISIQAGTFEVAGGCAGLNYLLGGLVVGAFYAHLFLDGWRARLAVVGTIAAISLVGNWVRVSLLVVIGHVSGMQSSLIEDHLWMGWAIFALGLVPFFLIARWMGRRDVGRPAHSVDGTLWSEPGVNEAFGGSSPPARRVVVVSGFAVVGPFLYLGIGALPERGEPEPDSSVLASGSWSAVDRPAPRPFTWRPAYAGAHESHTAVFSDGGARVYLDRLVYRSQEQGNELIGHPNRIALDGTLVDERLVGPVDAARRLWVRQAVIRAAEGPVLVWYWFRVGGVETASPITAKLLEVRSFLVRAGTSELVALSAPCASSGCERAFDALSSFTGASLSQRGAS